MAWKCLFWPESVRASGSCKSVRSFVVLGVQINYLLLFPVIFCTCVCISQARLSSACRGFRRLTFRLCFRSFDSAVFSSFLVTLVIRTVAFSFSWLSAVLVIQTFASRLFGDVGHMIDYFASVLLDARLQYSTLWILSS